MPISGGGDCTGSGAQEFNRGRIALNGEDLERYRVLARENLRDRRYEHVLNVTRLAGELAERYGEDVSAAQAAGLLHDVTKQKPLAEQLQTIQNSGILYDKTFLSTTNVYHAVTGYLYARDVLGIEDPQILNAIRYHTTGRAGMSRMEKIVYLADAVSYERDYPDAARLRKLAFSDLDVCMLEVLAFTVEKLVGKRVPIVQDTLDCYNEISQMMLERKGAAS